MTQKVQVLNTHSNSSTLPFDAFHAILLLTAICIAFVMQPGLKSVFVALEGQEHAQHLVRHRDVVLTQPGAEGGTDGGQGLNVLFSQRLFVDEGLHRTC